MASKIPVKEAWVKLGAHPAPWLTLAVRFEGTSRRIPAGEAVKVPLTAYYLRKLHSGELLPASGPAETLIEQAAKAPANGETE